MADKVSLATLALAKAYTDEHGGGGGGSSNYNDLTHKPTVNGVEFKGTMTGSDLGLVDAENGKGLSANDYTDADKTIVGGVTSALAGKVDKVSGKGLSTNDYSNTDKAVVDGVTTALNGKVDKVSGKGLSTNDYSDADKTIVDGVTTALNVKADKTETYLLKDTAETSLTDNDKFPFYDISVTSSKHTTWSNLKSKLKAYFDSLYATISSVYTKTQTDNLLADKFTYEDNAAVGAKNFWFIYSRKSYTEDGITFTINDDNSVTANGTTTSTKVAVLRFFAVLPKGTYILSGGKSADNFVALYNRSTSQYFPNTTSTGGDTQPFTFDEDTKVGFTVRIQSNQTVNNLTFYPMVRLATDTDDTYVAPAFTNRELTLALDGKLNKISGVFADPTEPFVGDIYNSEEQVVGTWGKQGHEKTLYMSALMSEGNIPFNTENSEIIETESHNIANIDEIVFAQFTCKPSSANVWSPLPHKKKYITIDRTDIIGYTSNSSNEQAAIKGLVYYTKTS